MANNTATIKKLKPIVEMYRATSQLYERHCFKIYGALFMLMEYVSVCSSVSAQGQPNSHMLMALLAGANAIGSVMLDSSTGAGRVGPALDPK